MAPTIGFCGAFSNRLKEIALSFSRNGSTIVVISSPQIEKEFERGSIPFEVCEKKVDILVGNEIGREGAFETVQSKAVSFLRTCAENYAHTTTIVESQDIHSLRPGCVYSLQERIQLSGKAFHLLSQLDQQRSEYLKNIVGKKNVLLIGSGGREHAIAWKLAQSEKVGRVFVAPGNGGTAYDPSSGKLSNVHINIDCHQELIDFAHSHSIDLCVVGPEAPLIDGIADKMNSSGIPTFGPSALAAQIEGSKAYAKKFMDDNKIPTAKYNIFTSYEDAKNFVLQVDYEIVIKVSGIAAGKGVILPKSKEEAFQALKSIMIDKDFGDAGNEVVIEQFLEGEEVSLLAFCDGMQVVLMPGAQDHKRIFDYDQGGNTGGMGAYAPAPCLTEKYKEQGRQIIQKVVEAMAAKGTPYIGVLYAGLILTSTGVYVIEFNCRFGDPETQVILPLLDSDFYDLLYSCVTSKLSSELVQWKVGVAATVVASAAGYPGSYKKGIKISGGFPTDKKFMVFHSGTSLNEDNQELLTNGGRIFAVSAYGNTLKTALENAYEGIDSISFEGMHFRKDIGMRGLIQQAPVLKIGVLGSTRGSSMQPILDAIEKGDLKAKIEVVISNKASSGILERGKKYNIPCVVVSSKNNGTREECDNEITNVLEQYQVDLVLLIGYMRILSPSFCHRWENRVLNVHPSLLPDFSGGMDLAVHQAVLDAKRTESGCTIHFVTPEVDSGRTLIQLKCNIEEGETPQSLKDKVQPLEGVGFIRAIKLFQAGMVDRKSNLKTITYADSGVNIDAGNALVQAIKPLCKSTRRPGCDASLGGFGGLFDLASAGYNENTVLVACTDGVGTKLKVAHMLDKHDTVGIDLVAMCVNDLIVQGAEPLFFLDYYATGELLVEQTVQVVEGIAEGCRQSCCGLIGGETAEMPSMYSHGDYDLAGFCIGAVDKAKLLPTPIEEDCILLGLPSSGIHSNGYSLVRKLIEMRNFNYKDPCPFQKEVSLGEAILTPTKIYVQMLMPIIRDGLVSALAHITGGGLVENIPRVMENGYTAEINLGSWELPPVFKWLQGLGNIPDSEMYRTFNCGIGMVLFVSKSKIEEVRKRFMENHEIFYEMGKVVRSNSNEPIVFKGSFH